MGGSSFDLIAQEIDRQNRLMKEVEAENQRLRQEIEKLRTGQGIFVEINGTRIALNALLHTNTQNQQTVRPQETAQPQQQPEASREKAGPRASFLEEMMLNEFENALTTPLASQQEPQHKPKVNEKSAEEQKASLRKALMGSYILE